MDYYNEWDGYAADWLRNLQKAGHLPAGTVDERSIEDVQEKDLEGVHHAHFFAGIGGWSLALRLAGWPAELPVWTGSCPCQPFSPAGKAEGVGDKRHLWPAFHRLIAECRPPVIFGEQVAGEDGRLWLAGVRGDLEDLGYAVGAADLCAAGVGAPHIRQRLYWVAHAENSYGRPGKCRTQEGVGASEQRGRGSPSRSIDGRVGQSLEPRLEGHAGNGDGGHEPGRNGAIQARSASEAGTDGGMGDSKSRGRGIGGDETRAGDSRHALSSSGTGCGGVADTDGGNSCDGAVQRSGEHGQRKEDGGTGFWSDSRLIVCRDGKARRIPLEPSLFPLAARIPGRVGLLRGAGGAIVPQVAAKFVRAYMEARNLNVKP